MSICESVSRVMQRFKAENNLSMQALSTRLEIPMSSTQCYLKGVSNPRADTLEMLAEKMNVPITEIVSCPAPLPEPVETILKAAEALSSLPPEQRQQVIQLLRELTALFAGDT